MQKPKYPHDCQFCIFMKTDSRGDWYVCPGRYLEDSHIVCRTGIKPEENSSLAADIVLNTPHTCPWICTVQEILSQFMITYKRLPRRPHVSSKV